MKIQLTKPARTKARYTEEYKQEALELWPASGRSAAKSQPSSVSAPRCFIAGRSWNGRNGVASNFQHSVTQFRFPLRGGRQGILFRLDRILARFFYASGLSRVEFNVRLKLRRNVCLGVDGVHRTFIDASHAIYALLRVNNQLTLQLIKARHRAYQHAVGELAPHTFIGNDMRHKLFHFQVDRAYESKLAERCGFANTFLGKCGKWGESRRRKMGSHLYLA
jgi:hypothetical protein